MNNTCVVVADGTRARAFTLVADAAARRGMRLLEQWTLTNPEAQTRGRRQSGQVKSERNTNRQAGPVHPIGAQRERHRLEQDRRFASEVVDRVCQLVAAWDEGRILLIAEPQLLGLMRARLRGALKSAIRLEELAKDYSGLSTAQLERLFAAERLFQ